MVDRVINYVGAVPLDVDLLNTNKNMMIGLGMLAKAILGNGTLVDGLECTPTGPASLNVLLASGSIMSNINVDGTAFGSLGSDTTRQIVKQGIRLGSGNIPASGSFAVPSTSGQSVNYLIQAQYQDVDGGSTVLPYYNAANPAVAFSGPAGLGTSQNTVRFGSLIVNVKAGTAATTGTQVTPTPDAGFTGLWVVTIANGATTIISGNITPYTTGDSNPIISEKLKDKISLATGDARYALSGGGAGAIRTRLTNNTVFHVATTGNDTTGDGSSGTPWATIQKAYNFVVSSVDIAGFSCTISVADGTYSAGLNAMVPTVGGVVTLQGNLSTPANCVISSGGSAAIAAFDGVQLVVGGFKITGSSYLLMARGPASVTVTGAMEYGTGGGALLGHINAFWGGFVEVQHAYTISGGAGQHLYSSDGTIIISSQTVTLTGTPAFSGNFALCSDGGVIEALANTFSGSATGNCHLAQLNAVINTNTGNTTYFPGNSAGTATTGGQFA